MYFEPEIKASISSTLRNQNVKKESLGHGCGLDAWFTLTTVEIEEAVEVPYPRLEARVEILAIDMGHETTLWGRDFRPRYGAGSGLAVAHVDAGLCGSRLNGCH